MDAETEDKMTTETPARKPRKRGPKTQLKFPCLRCGRVRQARNRTAICQDCQGADPWFVQQARAS